MLRLSLGGGAMQRVGYVPNPPAMVRLRRPTQHVLWSPWEINPTVECGWRRRIFRFELAVVMDSLTLELKRIFRLVR